MSTITPQHSSTADHAAPTPTVDHLFQAAFSAPRAPRSAEYMDGVRAALAFHLDGQPIGQPHQPATAEADAFYVGVEEGHSFWRARHEHPTEAHDAANSFGGRKGIEAIRQQAHDINVQAGDIEILIGAIFDKIDDSPEDPATAARVAAINCFATCVIHRAATIKEASNNILALTSANGSA